MAPPSAPDTFNGNTHVASGNSGHNPLFKVNSPNVQYTGQHILSKYSYQNTLVERNDDGTFTAKPIETTYNFKTDVRVPKVGWVSIILFCYAMWGLGLRNIEWML